MQSFSLAEAPTVAGVPILGALPEIALRGMLEFFERAWRKNGDVFRLRMGRRSILNTVHPDAVERVLITNRDNYIKGDAYQLLRQLTGDGLLTLEGDAWRKRRRMVQPAFHRETIRALVATMSRVTAQLFDELQQRGEGTIDAHHEMMRITLDIVAQTLFGQRMGARSERSARAFSEAVEILTDRGNLPVSLPQALPTPGNRRLRRALTVLDELVFSIIGQARREAGPPSLLGMLMESRDADTGEVLTDRELRNEIITLVFAGHETTALLLTWGFTLLGRHPEIVVRMRDEVDAVVGARAPTAEDLPKLVYLRQVVDEILRLRGPVWALGRDVVADDVIGGVRVFAGETIMPLNFLTHRHPAFWEDPDRFDPDRFTPGRSRGRHPWAYVPFSAGPRMCIGNMFTIAEAQVIFATLLQRCSFELASLKPVRTRPLMTLRPADPVRVRLHWHR